MKVIVTKSYEESCRAAANEIITQVQKTRIKIGSCKPGEQQNRFIRFW